MYIEMEMYNEDIENGMDSTKKVRNQEDNFNHVCHPDNSYPQHDAQGIYLCKVCDKCKDYKLSKYRPEILTGYGELDIDECLGDYRVL